MKIIALILSTAIMIFAFQSTAIISGTQDSDDKTEIFELASSKTGVEDFIAAYGDKVEMKSDDCYNVTPEKMTEKYGFSVFKSKEDNTSILIYNDRIYLLGEYFGGSGVTSFAVSDIDHDGFRELYFIYSWGSGIDHSEMGCFNTKDEKVTYFDFCCLNSYVVMTNDDGVLSVCGSSWADDDKPAEKIATITYNGSKIIFNNLSDKK